MKSFLTVPHRPRLFESCLDTIHAALCLQIRRTEMRTTLLLIALSCLLPLAAQAQTFNSGSTGADGALDLTAGNREVQLPESGILNYTTVNIPAGKKVTFKRNLRNTPVIMLASGNITIHGTIDVSAPISQSYPGPTNSVPGPGGFNGAGPCGVGFGPGGGLPPNGDNGRWLGPLSLVPIIGGSGGGGFNNSGGCWPGGGGGGAILIASSGSITLTTGASIQALGRHTWSNGGTAGSGGAIRLVANALNVSGEINACGGNCGVVRLEAPQGALAFTGTSSPPAVLSTINPVTVPSAAPALNIISIGGYSVPSYSGQRFDTVDLLLPRQLPEPISVVVQASNVPVGSQVKVVFSGSGQATATTGTLTGSLASSTATLSISGLDRSGAITYLFASAVFDLPQSVQNFNLKGRDEIAQVRVEAAPGAKPKYVFLRKDGSEVERGKLPLPLLQQFGVEAAP
jgi:hypothetical protein